MMPAAPIDITDSTNKVCAFLMASGRWVERLVPTGNGDHHMIIARLYGYLGASQDKHDQGYRDAKVKNEALFAAAAIRIDQFPNIPYHITAHLNDDPAKSDTVCRCVDNDVLTDLPADWKGQSELPRTVYRAGIQRNGGKRRHSD